MMGYRSSGLIVIQPIGCVQILVGSILRLSTAIENEAQKGKEIPGWIQGIVS